MPQLLSTFGRVLGTTLSVSVLVVILKPPLYATISDISFNLTVAMHTLHFFLIAHLFDSHIPLRLKGVVLDT